MKKHHFDEHMVEGQSWLHAVVEVGSIEVLPHEARAITIEAETQQMVLTVNRDGNRVTVRAEREDNRNHLQNAVNQLLKREQPEAIIRVWVPSDCEVSAKAVTGQLVIRDLHSPVTAHVVTGRACLENLQGPVYAKTITGSVRYRGDLGERDHRFETVTGRLQFTLTQEPDAKLDARAVTGLVHCDFPLRDQVRHSHLTGSRLTGVLGSGAGHLVAHAVTGGVHLERASKEVLGELGEAQ